MYWRLGTLRVHSNLRAGKERIGLIENQPWTKQLNITFLLWVELYLEESYCVARWSLIAGQIYLARESSQGTDVFLILIAVSLYWSHYMALWWLAPSSSSPATRR